MYKKLQIVADSLKAVGWMADLSILKETGGDDDEYIFV